jgi:hypothetical protein
MHRTSDRTVGIQQARQLTWTLADRPEPVRFLIHDRDQKFTSEFDEVFRSDGSEIVRTPFRAPQSKGWRSDSCGPSVRSVSTGSWSSIATISTESFVFSLITTTDIVHTGRCV